MNTAVIDIGKTNAKVALVRMSDLTEIEVVTRPNTVLTDGPWPHFDLEGHWEFILAALAQFQRDHGISGISVTTHGAAAVLLDVNGGLAAPMLDYEHIGPDALADEYEALRPPFEETGSPRLPMGLNLGAQLHWLFSTDPTLLERTKTVVTYPQYWGFRLTGKVATDVSSLGCHTDLWNPWEGGFSTLVSKLGLSERLAPAHKSDDILGRITADIAERTGLSTDTPVVCGIHDSNASLLPHVLGRTGPFSVVSTGTWVVVMSMGGQTVPLDATRDTLVNVNAMGNPVPSARFMGGREYEVIRDGRDAATTAEDRDAVLGAGSMLLPSVEPGSGPFQGREAAWIAAPDGQGARMVALGFYLALMTKTCLDLVGAEGPAVIEGPFARNVDYLDMLAAIHSAGVEVATSATGTSVGAAMLLADMAKPPATHGVEPTDATRLRNYAAKWQEKVSEIIPV